LPLLELFHGFIKIVQAQDIYVVDLIKVVKLVQVDIWHYYNVVDIAFKDDVFIIFNKLINFQNESPPLLWAMNHACPSNDFMWCAFHVGIELAWLHVDDLHTRKTEPISPALGEQNLETMNIKCFKVGFQFFHELLHLIP
jgi:hypothetical protein